MTELKKYYETKLADFKELHEEWVQSNRNLNGLWLAKRQIHSEGVTRVDFATEILENAIKTEKARNEKLLTEVNGWSSMLGDLERYIRDNFGENLHGVYEIRGY